MSPREFRDAWGEGLLLLPAPYLQAVPISEASRRFLLEAGLPEEAKPDLVFYQSPDALAPLPDVVPEMHLPVSFQRYRVLADDGGTFLCIDTEDHEHIVSVDPYQELMTRFVNSTVLELAECLLAYRALPGPEQAKTATKQTIRGWNDQLKVQFNTVDPAALSGPDNWWSSIIGELEIFTR